MPSPSAAFRPVRSMPRLKFLEDEAHKILPTGYVIDYTGGSRQLRTEGSKFLARVFASRSC